MPQAEHPAVPALSVGGKLALLSVCSVSVTLAVVGLLFQAVLKDLREDDAWSAIEHGAEAVESRLAEQAARLLTTATSVAELKSVAAVTHLVEAYETPQRYLPALFDIEKEGLADTLAAQLPLAGADGMAVYSRSHDLIAFGCLCPEAGLLHGYRSLVDGRGVVRTFRGDRPVEPEPLLAAVMAPARLGVEPVAGLRATPAGLLQYAQVPILRGNDLEGAVVAAALVDQRFTEAVGQQTDLTVWLVPSERHDTPIAGLSVPHVLAAAPTDAGPWRVPHPQWHLGAVRRDVDGGSLLILLGRGKALDAMDLRALNISVGAALALIGLVMAPLTLLAGRGLIGRPLARITASLEPLWRGEPLGDKYLRRGDEVGALAAALNSLLASVKAREAELALSQAHYKTLYDRAPVGYAAMSGDEARLVEANRAFDTLMAAPEGGLCGLALAELCGTAESRARLDELLQRVRAGGTVRDEEVELRRRDGEPVWLSLSMDVDASAAPPLVRVAALDISERMRAQQQLRQTLDALSRSHAELAEFARIAAHDLREPSRLVVSYAQLLERRLVDRLTGDDLDCLRFLAQSARIVYNQVQDVLDFARLGRQEIAFGWVDCAKVVDGVLLSLAETIAASGGTVTVAPLPTVYANPLELPRVFDHLIRNALKFRAPDRLPDVRIAAAETEDEWVFSVSDNGIGIEPIYFEKIFGVFRRLHGRDAYPGTGIGLAICKRVIEHHKGRIWVESEPGKGSVFRFAIPHVAARAAAAE